MDRTLSDNAVSNGGYYITQQQVQLERAREVEQRLMTELQQLTREKEQVTRDKEQVCSLYNLLACVLKTLMGFCMNVGIPFCFPPFYVFVERAATDETSPGIVHY